MTLCSPIHRLAQNARKRVLGNQAGNRCSRFKTRVTEQTTLKLAPRHNERLERRISIKRLALQLTLPVLKLMFVQLTQLEHILKRPDTYIGSVERTESKMWVYNSQTESMESREVNYVPGLYKIFDEVLVNAADNKQRDKNMDEIKVVVDRENGFISVKNNGRGIPIEIHSVSSQSNWKIFTLTPNRRKAFSYQS